MVLWVTFRIYTLLLSSHCAYVLDMYTSLCHCALLIVCSNDNLLCYDHRSHFHMTVLCLIKLLICFTTCLLDHMFTCYIILVLLSLDLPWGSNAFCASVSGYKYICSKCYIGFRFRCEWVLPLFPNSRLSLESVIGCFVTE